MGNILGLIGSNIVNVILLVIFYVLVHTILTLATGAPPSHGLPNPIADPAAFRLGMYIFLGAMILSGAASGFLSQHFLRMPPAMAGFVSCSVLPTVILMNHLRMPPLAPGEPSHGVFIACCIMTMMFGSVSAVLRAPAAPRGTQLYR